MQQLIKARIGILCVSWWGEKNSDSQLLHLDGYTDEAVTLILDYAEKYNIKVCFHHEPYEGRTANSLKNDLKYIINHYGNHKAFFRWKEYENRPVFFVYDSYLIDRRQWATILDPKSPDTIRGTFIDSILIALYVDLKDEKLITEGHFDGGYTYFATNGFTYGSSISNWKHISEWANLSNKIFIPSVGPGYDDTRIRQ